MPKEKVIKNGVRVGRPAKDSNALDRYIKVYAQDMKQYDRWATAAEKAGLPKSRFLRNLIEQQLNGTNELKAEAELQTEINQLQNQLNETRYNNHELKNQNDFYRKKLEEVRNELFEVKYHMDQNQDGEFNISMELLQLIKEHGQVKIEEIPSLLNIQTNDNSVIMMQLQKLEEFKLIRKQRNGKGYKWVQ